MPSICSKQRRWSVASRASGRLICCTLPGTRNQGFTGNLRSICSGSAPAWSYCGALLRLAAPAPCWPVPARNIGGAARRYSDETVSPIGPATLYGVAKDAVRRVSLAYAESSTLSVAWGRLFYLYGPHEKPGRFVSDAITCLLAERPFGTTEAMQRRDFMHVEDVAGALSALLVSDVRGCVNVASGHVYTLRHLLEIVADETHGRDLVRFGERPMPANDPELVGAAIERLRDEVGFTPRLTLKEGLVQTIDWWRSQQ